MNAVECEGLEISLGPNLILSNVNLTIEENQFIGVFGPNGAGKTTFMKSLLGIIPYKGQIKIVGCSPIKARKSIGYVPQQRDSAALSLKGRAFIATAIRGTQLGIPFLSRSDQKEIDRVLEYVQATELAECSLSEMSGGQKQRLLLGQALLGKPKILMLDEPLSNLDPKWTENILTLIKQIQQQEKLTVILSTHDLNPLIGFMDKILCLNKRNVVLGDPEDVITSAVLTELYETSMHVIRIKDRIFVTQFS